MAADGTVRHWAIHRELRREGQPHHGQLSVRRCRGFHACRCQYDEETSTRRVGKSPSLRTRRVQRREDGYHHEHRHECRGADRQHRGGLRQAVGNTDRCSREPSGWSDDSSLHYSPCWIVTSFREVLESAGVAGRHQLDAMGDLLSRCVRPLADSWSVYDNSGARPILLEQGP